MTLQGKPHRGKMSLHSKPHQGKGTLQYKPHQKDSSGQAIPREKDSSGHTQKTQGPILFQNSAPQGSLILAFTVHYRTNGYCRIYRCIKVALIRINDTWPELSLTVEITLVVLNPGTVTRFYTDTRYNDKIRYNDNLNVTKPSLKR